MQVNVKAWGQEEVICNEPEYCAKYLHIDAGFQSSLHMHLTKKETFRVLSGIVHLELAGERTILSPGDIVTILPHRYHRFSSAAGATILEVSTHHSDDDVVRLEPSRRME
jgi:mannose-6-phosphate isomerase-like protein (cupin superfamily)